jgi:asparagine N-glycosylation enzyme membrane subunit Stt3
MTNHLILLGLTSIILISIISGCTQKTTITIDGNKDDWQNIPIFIPDTAGDVTNEKIIVNNISREIYEFDVTAIKLAMDTHYLYILVELANNTDYYFTHNREYARVIGELYFDTDNNNSTGGKAFASQMSGFENKISLYTGVWNTATGIGISGREKLTNATENSMLEYFIEFWPSHYNESSQKFEYTSSVMNRSYNRPDLITYKGKYIEMKLPSSDVGISTINQTIRVIFAERGSGLGEESFSEEVTGKIFIIKE